LWHVNVGEHQAAFAEAHELQRLIGVGRGDRLVTQVGNELRQHRELCWIVVQNTRSQRGFERDDLDGLRQGLDHETANGKLLAIQSQISRIKRK
jgi:hypothetical protein